MHISLWRACYNRLHACFTGRFTAIPQYMGPELLLRWLGTLICSINGRKRWRWWQGASRYSDTSQRCNSRCITFSKTFKYWYFLQWFHRFIISQVSAKCPFLTQIFTMHLFPVAAAIFTQCSNVQSLTWASLRSGLYCLVLNVSYGAHALQTKNNVKYTPRRCPESLNNLFALFCMSQVCKLCKLQKVRKDLYDELTKIHPEKDWSFILRQIGMFSFTGLTPKQVRWLLCLLKSPLPLIKAINRLPITSCINIHIPSCLSYLLLIAFAACDQLRSWLYH